MPNLTIHDGNHKEGIVREQAFGREEIGFFYGLAGRTYG